MSITDFKVWTVCLNTNWSTTIRIMKTIFLYSKSVPWIQDLERCVNTHRSRSRIQGTLLKYRKIVFIILIVVNQLVFKQTVHTLKSVIDIVDRVDYFNVVQLLEKKLTRHAVDRWRNWYWKLVKSKSNSKSSRNRFESGFESIPDSCTTSLVRCG